MKQVININFQGRVVPIEVSAYDILKAYIDSLSRHFAAEDGKDEIINDIENRIGELFQERIKNGATCITDDDVNAIIKSMGRPEDFETEEASFSQQNEKTNEGASSNTETNTNTHYKKRLYRDENQKIIGGVCSGIANYFGIDVVVVRVIFLILVFSFGFGLLPYIILWIATPSSSTTEIGSMRKKLYRDGDEKYVGGVCSGLAHYFGISVWIPRVLFLIPFLSFVNRWNHWDDGFNNFGEFLRLGFSPGAVFIYIILWLVLPEATTTAEKLEMKGEKVDMNSIKNAVVDEMKGVQQRVQKFSKEATIIANEKSRAFSSEASSIAKKSSRGLGDIIALLVKIFVYFILAVVGFSLVVALFSLGIVAIGIFPAKDFVLTQGWQTALAWGTLIFFILTPMIGVITWIIRKIAKIKAGSKLLRFGFSALWVVGWVCFIFLISSVFKDFKANSNIIEQQVTLTNPSVKSLEITTLAPGQRYSRSRFFTMSPFEGIDDDTAFVKNTIIQIVKSPNDSFKITMMKMANGSNKRYADTAASLINFNAYQQDSFLIINNGIAINKTDKFRNQRVVITVYVPVGKQIKVNDKVDRNYNVIINGPNNGNWEDVVFENTEDGWNHGVWYTMTKDGLYTLDGKPADTYKNNRVRINKNGIDVKDGNGRVIINSNGIQVDDDSDDEDAGTYRYNTNEPPTNKVDSLKLILQKEEQRMKDSLKKEKEKIDKQLEKYQEKAGGTATLFEKIPGHNPIRSVI
ncbi:PspC domain-containing protein [Ferruginibacter yonginensis]|uniref:PspC domain-containing protein n=1 Tax=Ferruginibacter yonginensis TaxID=1310416 RepID=A0ABV8QRP2_9BACT